MTTKVDQLPFIDMTGPGFTEDPDSIVVPALERGPLAYSERGLEVLGHKECVELLRDRRLRANHMLTVEFMGFPEGPALDFKRRMLLGHGRDEYRTRIRRTLTRTVGRSVVQQQRPMIRQLVRDLLKKIESNDETDFLYHYAFMTPATLFCLWFDAPIKDAPWVAKISDRILRVFSFIPSYTPDILAAYDELFPYVQELLDKALEAPKDNLLGALIAEHRAGHIDHQELLDIVTMFNEASTDNTAHGIATVVGQLLSDQQRCQQIVDHPEVIPGAVREAMRLAPRINTLLRYATEDFEYQGVTITEGTPVHILTYAGQRDSSIYKDPLTYDPTREIHNLDFGGGAFSCLGIHVAMIEIEEAIAELADSYPDARLDSYEISRNYFVNEVADLHVSLHARE